ncbi:MULTISPECIES: TrkA C-terminal domain-containing protein [unclassified Bacillus (in: firmicutes)]|uniref:TrkA C-terminal domain-containing protein n=1 Tax=unclassified Bacillus (in: firmicutes) TaxID=185979 RepID=UPI001BEBCB09|nr:MULTISPECIES: TrkA C-terminal domain-containing protein [unclassified Bacillus (in: firmicutes)]MBT2637750.1 TrkA C-terminal domain-containing protein [Bacillus sp. ISL-39]MBT2640962.1 TrkA C-terminal domain-containing protein [Bacillus sp. ISL-41]MBT2661886.1 TrkA C-terminal domain-containing protein [Bacillus sp. ISL-45]
MGILFIFIYLFIVFTVIEINTSIFVATGLDRKIARFQVISMLTGTGFTTGESELIIDHPVRRKLGAFLILFGAFSLAVIISAISKLLSDSFYTMEIAYVAVGLLALLFILKAPTVQKKIGQKMKSELKENYELADLPISDVLLMDDDDEVREIALKEDSRYADRTFDEIVDKEDDVMLLFIKRGAINIRNKAYDTKLEPGDKLILYGNNPRIEEIFEDA